MGSKPGPRGEDGQEPKGSDRPLGFSPAALQTCRAWPACRAAGLFQGGIVPSYALIVRECSNPREAGARVGTVLLATLLGMALGGWVSGAIFGLTGSYRAAFVNAIAWNLLNVSIVVWLLLRARAAQRAHRPATCMSVFSPASSPQPCCAARPRPASSPPAALRK